MGYGVDTKQLLTPELFEPNKKPNGSVQMAQGIGQDFENFWLLGNGSRDVVTGHKILPDTDGGGDPWVEVSTYGNVGLHNDGSPSATVFLDTENNNWTPDNIDYTLVLHAIHDGATSGGMGWFVDSWQTNGIRLTIRDSAGSYQVYYRHMHASGTAASSGHGWVTSPIPSNTPFVFVAGVRNGQQFWAMNGYYYSGVSNMEPPEAASNRNRILSPTYAQTIDGEIWSVGKIDHGITKPEAIALSINLYGETLAPIL